jgi:uncharacterized protein
MNTLITEFVVTEQCNLACDYCYMKDKNTFMSISGVENYIENVQKIMDVYGCSKYHISYFGGEPLMNWKVVKEAIPKFHADPRCDSQVIITNGLLITQDIIDYCKQYNVGFSWSFDGLWQEENRPHKDTKDSLSIYREKKELLKSVSGSCKVMVGPQNSATMTENLEFLIDDFGLANPDFSLVRDDIWSEDEVIEFKFESHRLANRIVRYFKEGQNVSVGFYVLALMDMINGQVRSKRPFGCFAGCHGVGYFPNGDWYPCARFGAAKEFILMDSNNKLHHKNITALLNPIVSDPRVYPVCQDCKLYNFCNAGCTYSQLRIDKNGLHYAEPVQSICDLYHIIYDDTLYINDLLKDNELYQQYTNHLIKQLSL